MIVITEDVVIVFVMMRAGILDSDGSLSEVPEAEARPRQGSRAGRGRLLLQGEGGARSYIGPSSRFCS